MKYCNKCNLNLSDNANFCTKCGAELVKIDNVENKRTFNYILIPVIIFIILILGYFIQFFVGFFGITTFEKPKNNHSQKNETIENIKKSEIYKYEPFGIYVYLIPKNKFNLKNFVNYSQKLKKGNSGYVFTFVFNKEIYSDELKNVNKSIPLYTLDAIWNQTPYFYFTHADKHSEQFCKINSNQQEHYYRNLVKGEKLFTHIKTYSYDRLNASTGCTYKQHEKKDTDIQNLTGSRTRKIFSYNNLGRAGLGTFAYNLTTSQPSNDYFYHYTNGTPFRLQVTSAYSDYVIVSGNYIDSYIRPAKDLAIKTNRKYVNGEFLSDNTYYAYIGTSSYFGGRMWTFQEVELDME